MRRGNQTLLEVACSCAAFCRNRRSALREICKRAVEIAKVPEVRGCCSPTRFGPSQLAPRHRLDELSMANSAHGCRLPVICRPHPVSCGRAAPVTIRHRGLQCLAARRTPGRSGANVAELILTPRAACLCHTPAGNRGAGDTGQSPESPLPCSPRLRCSLRSGSVCRGRSTLPPARSYSACLSGLSADLDCLHAVAPPPRQAVTQQRSHCSEDRVGPAGPGFRIAGCDRTRKQIHSRCGYRVIRLIGLAPSIPGRRQPGKAASEMSGCVAPEL